MSEEQQVDQDGYSALRGEVVDDNRPGAVSQLIKSSATLKENFEFYSNWWKSFGRL